MEKKNPYKFTLGFDKTKLTHVRAAEILNSVRDKADLIASAVVAHIDGGSTEKGAVLNQEALQIMMLELVKQEVEKSVEEAKQKVTAAEKSIELFNKGEYKEAYVIEQKKLALETAQEAYDVAKAIYDTALAQVKSVLETLSK